MGYEKLQRPVLAPSFTPEASDLAQGLNGQLLIAQTNDDTAYKTVSGDVTIDKDGVTAVGAKKITFAKAKVFFAAQQTGTGAPQNVAHGLGVVPTAVLLIPTDGGTIVPGVHDGTNVKATVTVDKLFDVMAWA